MFVCANQSKSRQNVRTIRTTATHACFGSLEIERKLRFGTTIIRSVYYITTRLTTSLYGLFHNISLSASISCRRDLHSPTKGKAHPRALLSVVTLNRLLIILSHKNVIAMSKNGILHKLDRVCINVPGMYINIGLPKRLKNAPSI
jgi:hypothetical protein